MSYARSRAFPHRRRLFPRHYTRRGHYTRRVGRRRRRLSDLAILTIFAIVLIIIALAGPH